MNESKSVETQNIVFALASIEQALYAGRTSGVFRSLNAGKTWHNTFDAFPQLQGVAATALAVHNQTVFAGVEGAIVRSENGGDKWESVMLGSPAPLVSDIAVSPHYDRDQFVVAATAEDGVFVSNDRGLNWNAWNFGLVDLNVNCISLASNQTIFVGTESGIFRSRNLGKTWREVPFPMEAAPVLSVYIDLPHIWAGTETKGLYVSSDDGQTWEKIALIDVPDESVHVLLFTSNNVIALTDHHLLQFQSQDFSCRKLHIFHDLQALALAQIGEQIAIGFTDGEIRIVYVT